DMAATDHREARRAVEVRRARRCRHGLLAGVDEVWVDLVVGRVGADAEQPVLGVQDDVDASGEVVRHECRQTDAEVDVLPVGELLCGAYGHLLACAAHCAPPCGSRIVRRSMRLSAACSGVSTSTRCTKIPGRWMRSGSIAPTSTTSSASTI